jgi:hypothetical protein
MMFASTQLHAYLTINDVRINDGSGYNNIIYGNVRPTITAIATITNDGPSKEYKQWYTTTYIVDGDPSSCKVLDNTNRGVGSFTNSDTNMGSNSDKDAFLASLSFGKHNVTFKASGSDKDSACGAADASQGFTIEVERKPFLIINDVTVNSGNPIPAESSNPNIVVTATIMGKGNRWYATAYIIDGGTCYYSNTNDHTTPGTHTNTFTSGLSSLLDRLPAGKHNVTFIASSEADPCTVTGPGYNSEPFTIEVERVPSFVINNVSINDDNTVTVGSVSANIVINATISRGTWYSTAYIIDGICYDVNTDDYSSSSKPRINTFSTSQSTAFVERLPMGKSNVTFFASTSWFDPCKIDEADESLPFTIEVEKQRLFTCDKLYMVRDNGDFYAFNDPTQSAVVGSVLMDLEGDDTIALGPWGNESGPLTLHYWAYTGDRDIKYLGDSVGEYTILGSEGTSSGSWSGGEVNQMTGEVYFSSSEFHDLEDKFRLGIYNTADGTFIRSGRLSPAMPSDTLKGYVSSDMAIDAKGNFYILVRNAPNHELVKVVRGEHNGNWKYSRVKTITGINHQEESIWGMAFLNGKLYVGNWHLFEIDPLTGVAKYQGEVRDHPTPTTGNRYFLDLSTCQVAAVTEGKVYYDANGDGILTSEEKNAPGVANVNVDIHDANGVKIGGVVTSGDGSYSLLLPKTNTTFYIRLNQPHVNGSNAHQTWASGGRYSWSGTYQVGNNTVTPKCYNDPTLSNKTDVLTNQVGIYPQNTYDKYGIACNGAKADGIDPSGNININNANYYSIVNVTTDRAVIEVDFALGPIDRGDAPASYGDASHSIAGSNLKIGDQIDADDVSRASADALGDDKNGAVPDDEEGVWITIPSEDGLTTRTLPLDDAIFTNSNNITLFTRVPYTFTAKVSKGGYLSAWTHINKASGTTGSFTERMHNETEIKDGGVGDEDGLENGEITFTYIIPRSIKLSGKQNIFFRFRYSSVKDGYTKGLNPARGDSWWNAVPWVTTGEVEDYGVLYDASATPFYCSILYATTLNGTIYGFINPAVSTSFIENDFLFWFNSTKYGNMGSIAIGKYIDKIAMFSWSYDSNQTIKVVKSGESNISTLTAPRALAANIGARGYWSGGVRHPQNEKMYLSGYTNLTIHASPYTNILTYDTSGGQLSGNLIPALAGAEIRGRLASDVFLGADGHIYTLGVEDGSYYLLHINPDNWQYAKGAAVSGLSADKWIYGLAFLNGKIYATTTDREFYEIDPTTGNSKRISGSIANDSYYDLASCQVAPILRGTLYFDQNADGALSTAEKDGVRLSNVTVELYDENRVYLSTAITNANGEYSFMLNNLGDTAPFYIRVKQPHIGGYRAVQTWASGSNTTLSSVYGVCDNANHTADGECYGVNGPLGIDGGGSDLADANYYSILIVKDSSVPSVVDFGFSGVDRSDAPLVYGEVYHSALKKIITMGSGIDADLESLAGEDASKDSYDDGVQIKPEGGSYTALQSATLEANTTYIFKVSLNGNMSSEGVLRAWISLSNVSGKMENYMIPIYGGSNISDSYVEFNYTVPMSMFGDEYVYLRFRFALENNTLKGNNHNGASWAWNMGEVEDYRVRVKNNNPRDLEEIYNEDLYGDARIIGNTIMARANATNFTPICPVNNENNDANNKNNTVCWNVDNLTFSSSNAYLDIPNGAEVKAAFLRWQGGNIRNVAQYNNATKVTLIDAHGSSQTVTAELMNWYDHAYQGTANITNIVKGAGAGNYSVGNIFTSFDKNSYGAWAIIVAYENQADNEEVLRKVTIYDGFAPVESSSSKSVTVGGFKTSKTGKVDSKMYLFAGEGDAGGGDSISVNSITVGGSDPVNGGITYFGANVLDRNASCVNNLAADIHTYNTGTNGSVAIGNNVEEATARFITSNDVYYVGLVGFSIQLYEPRVCYYIDTIVNLKDNSAIFSNGTFGTNIFSENQEYSFTMFIANIQDTANSTDRDEARNVQAHMSYLKPDQLNYTIESTEINNVGVGYSYATDLLGDDLGEYENASYKHTWRLGHGADDSKGGSFDVAYDLNTPEKSLIKLKMYLGKIDENASKNGINLLDYLRFQASYNSGISNATRVKDIEQCRDMRLRAVTDPIIGSFNVVNENFAGDKISRDADDADNALYTQISGREFKVKLIALEDSSDDPVKLVDYNTNNTNVSIDLIDGKRYDECVLTANSDNTQIESCCGNEASIGSTGIVEMPFSQDDNITIGIKKLDITLNATTSNGKFRVTWYKTVGVNTVRYSCSADRFAVRPDRFKVDNMSGTKLIGGAENNATLKAYKYGMPETLANYNQTASALSYNATLELPATCNSSEIDTNINSTNFFLKHSNFVNGQSNINIRYDNVGNMSAVVIDNNYTYIDQVKYDNSAKEDCLPNNATNNEDSSNHKIGCDIASDNVSMRFVPAYFKADVAITNANGGTFTYLSNNANMTAEVTTSIDAMIATAGRATNYHKSCFAKDVTYRFDIENNNFTDYNTSIRVDPDKRAVFFEKDTIATLEDNNNASNGTGEFKIKEDNFVNGKVSSIEFGFNFNRSISVGENPFILHVSDDINIADSAVYDDDTHSTNATVVDANITFLYGRVFIDNQDGVSPITVPVEYELFCVNCGDKTRYGTDISEISSKDSQWFSNDWHNSANYGDVITYTPQGSSDITLTLSPAAGTGSVTIENRENTPYQDTIHAVPNDWLIYNTYNPNADHIEFIVKFLGDQGGWAGRGNTNISIPSATDPSTGVVLDVLPGNRTKLKADW